MKKIFDLPVCGSDRAKSFYGKAKVIETENGEKVLQSYNTFVCRITAGGAVRSYVRRLFCYYNAPCQ